MPKHDLVDRDRRTLLAASGALMLGSALWPAGALGPEQRRQDADRHHRRGPYRQHHRRALGQERPQGVFLRPPSRGAQRPCGGLGPLAAGRNRRRRPSPSATRSCSTVPYGAIPQIGHDYAAQLKGKIVLDTCNAVPARDGADRRRGRAERHRRDHAKVFPGRAASSAPSTPWATCSSRRKPIAPIRSLRYRLPATMPRRCASRRGLVRDAGFDPVVVGKLADAKLFQRGGPGYGQRVSAAELKQKLHCRAMTGDATGAAAAGGAAGRWPRCSAGRARRCRPRRRSAPRRCGRLPISSCCWPATTCSARCATRWASPAG